MDVTTTGHAFTLRPPGRDRTPMRQLWDSAPLRPLRRYFGVMRRPQTYLSFVYLLLGLPLGVAYFVALVTGITVSGALAITLIGLPMLVAMMYIWCIAAGFDRVVTNVLLGTRINPLPFGREQGRPWQWRRIKARISNAMTWRSLAYLFLRFPVGIAGFVLAIVLVAIPLGLISLPITAPAGKGRDFGFLTVDSAWEGAVLVIPGILLLPVAMHLGNFAAWVAGRLAQLFLGTPGRGAGEEAVDRAVASAVKVARALPRAGRRAALLPVSSAFSCASSPATPPSMRRFAARCSSSTGWRRPAPGG